MRTKKQPVEKHPIHVKSGDKVVVTSGKDKGKVSSVKKVITSENKVIVEGANIVTKAQKAQGGNQGAGLPLGFQKEAVVPRTGRLAQKGA